MQLEITDTSATGLPRMPISNIRWAGIVAGLVVGIATNLLLMLFGASVGLAAMNVGEEIGGATIPVAAGIWNTASMVISAFVGAYVAARSAGMRRWSDGILHGVVAWGLTMLLTAFLATTAVGSIMGSLLGSPAARTAAAQSAPLAGQVARSINEGDRADAIRALQSRLGISGDQAAKMVDQALIIAGREENVSPAGRESAQDALRMASTAGGWLTAAIVLSLLAAAVGGWLGARGTHRVMRTPAVVRAPIGPGPGDTATLAR